MKIVYSGIQYDRYDPKRGTNFEYDNFYKSLLALPNTQVVNVACDRILDVGVEKFNAELLATVQKEKPDLFFAFMYSDEFQSTTLDAIKKITKSVGWFADDHWRLHNYSRFFVPHFTFGITTWSKAPDLYRSYGISNVIRSQWGCNPSVWKPLPDVPKDIDVSFVGQRNGSRQEIVDALSDAGISVYTRGSGWKQGRASNDEMISIFSRSKICLNFNAPISPWEKKSVGRLFFRPHINSVAPSFDFFSNFKTWRAMAIPQIKARPFELSACGAFVITPYADDFENYYRENEEMVFYRNTSELIEKITYYLAHDDERKKIAITGYQRTLAQHTYRQRFEDIFRNVGLS